MQVLRELRNEKLDFWIQHNLNVLFIGHYGVGKTTRILEAFKRNKLHFKYFSAATMDPWCDFIGVPKVLSDDKGAYLDYVLPRDLRDDSIEAIYMDEFNRSHKKVRNAVMELLQFKSINGRPFNKLRIIWAAINPEDEGEYQVEALDKAQKDRFQIQVNLPYEPSLDFFTSKFDIKQAKTIVNWWKTLAPEIQMEVSPRRLEYALQVFNMGGSLKDVLPHNCNPSKLANMMRTGPIDERMKEIYKSNDMAAARKFLAVENNFSIAQRHLRLDVPAGEDVHAWSLFFLQALSTEKLQAMVASDEDVYNFIFYCCDKSAIFRNVLNDIISVNTDKVLVRRIKKELTNNPAYAVALGHIPNATADKPYFSNRKSTLSWSSRLAQWCGQPMDTTPQRMKVYDDVMDWLPSAMTINEAVDTLDMFNLIASKSHGSTLKKLPHFMGAVNHCIDQIHKTSGMSWTEIQSNYGLKISDLLTKIHDSQLESGLLMPVKREVVSANVKVGTI